MNTDTCAAARSTSEKLVRCIEKAVQDAIIVEGRETKDPNVLRQDCHHHMRNIWIGAVVKCLSKYFDELLRCDLDEIDF